MDIDEKMDEILRTHQIYERENIGGGVTLKERLGKVILEIIDSYTSQFGSRVFLRGLKPSSEPIHPLLQLLWNKVEIVGVSDKAPFSRTLLLPDGRQLQFITEQDEMPEFDFCLVNAMHSGKDICWELRKRKNKVPIIDLYCEIRTKYSLNTSKMYEEYGEERDFSYNRLQEFLEKFRSQKTYETLSQLLGICLSRRDFISFFQYLREGKKCFPEDKALLNLESDVKRFLMDVKRMLRRRRVHNDKKDIVLHWLDQLGYEELEWMPKTKERMEKGLYFTNAYTVTPYTKPTARMLFFKEYRWKGGGEYLPKRLSDSAIYNRIKEKGYNFHAFGYLEGILNPSMAGEENCEMSAPASWNYWRMIREMISSKQPVFFMVHVLTETHEPFASPEADKANPCFEFQASYESEKEKMKVSASYIDRLEQFYAELLGEETVHIYMSDHGKWEDVDRRRWEDCSMHTILGIVNGGVCGRVDRLFSYENFENLTAMVLELAKPEQMFLCDVPIYSKGFQAAIRERTDSDSIASGYCGIRTSKDKYVVLDDGRELYYRCGTSGEKYLDRKDADIERIEFLREVCRKQREAL